MVVIFTPIPIMLTITAGETTVIQPGTITTDLISPTITATTVGITVDGITVMVILMGFMAIIILIGIAITATIQIIGGTTSPILAPMRAAM
jgi:hypothetical protein